MRLFRSTRRFNTKVLGAVATNDQALYLAQLRPGNLGGILWSQQLFLGQVG